MPRKSPRLPPLLAEFDDEEREAVLAANRAFYRAFNDRDAGAMEALWAPSGSMICLHPGQGPLIERGDIIASWRGILKHPQSPKVRCTDEWITGRPGLAIVVCREILDAGQLMATNTFLRMSDGWHMIGHHSGQVPPVDQPRPRRRLPPPPPRATDGSFTKKTATREHWPPFPARLHPRRFLARLASLATSSRNRRRRLINGR